MSEKKKIGSLYSIIKPKDIKKEKVTEEEKKLLKLYKLKYRIK